jgi:hypothetical protein
MHLSNTHVRRRVALFAFAALAATSPAARGEDFDPVPASEIASAPHRFWLSGFVFRETVLGLPGEEHLKLDGQFLYPFQSKVIGTCYATRDSLDAFRDLEVGREYLFAGTVYQKKSRFFGKGKFYVVVNKIVTPAQDPEGLVADLAAAGAATNNVYAEQFRTMALLLGHAQEALLAAAQKGGFPYEEAFDPASPHHDKLDQAARIALFRLENESKVPALEHMVQFITAMLAHRSGFAQPAPAVTEPAPAPAEPEVAPAVDVKAAADEDAPRKPRRKPRKEPAPTIPAAAAPATEPAANDQEPESPVPALRLTPSPRPLPAERAIEDALQRGEDPLSNDTAAPPSSEADTPVAP